MYHNTLTNFTFLSAVCYFIKVIHEERINCDHREKSLQKDLEFSWQVPFTMIFDDVHNHSQGADDIWVKEDHAHIQIIAEYAPSQAKLDGKPTPFPFPPLEHDAKEKELIKQFCYLQRGIQRFKGQFDDIAQTIRTRARCEQATYPWHHYIKEEVSCITNINIFTFFLLPSLII